MGLLTGVQDRDCDWDVILSKRTLINYTRIHLDRSFVKENDELVYSVDALARPYANGLEQLHRLGVLFEIAAFRNCGRLRSKVNSFYTSLLFLLVEMGIYMHAACPGGRSGR